METQPVFGSGKEGEGQKRVTNHANLLIRPPMSAMGDTEEQRKYLFPFSEIMRLCGKVRGQNQDPPRDKN